MVTTSTLKRTAAGLLMLSALLVAGHFAVQQSVEAPAAIRVVSASKPAVAVKPLLLSLSRVADDQVHLSDETAARYGHIFAFQEVGDWSAADREIKKLLDDRLMGHVLYQRYMHPTGYRASFDELDRWLVKYGDHPGAGRIYELALRRKPGDAAPPEKPRLSQWATGRLDLGESSDPYVSPRKRGAGATTVVRALKEQIVADLRRTAPSTAYKKLTNPVNEKLLDKVEFDILRAQIAAGYFFAGKTDAAYELASAAAKRSGKDAPLAGWVAGLSAWKKGDYKTSANFFEIAAGSARASSWTASASAYWAARAHLRLEEDRQAKRWLRKATEHRLTFYGLLAARALGREMDFNWDMPSLRAAHIEKLAEVPAGARALALLDAGQQNLAELELRQINPRGDTELLEAMLALTGKAGLPAASLRLGSAFEAPEGGLMEAALFPVAPESWQPDEGYKVDRALIHAFIRQESRFDPAVRSRVGARGLMQLMPQTASYVAGDAFSGDEQQQLMEPVLNIELGQRYLQTLLNDSRIEGDLFRLAVAYNAGPGNLSRWQRELGDVEDPLLFIESIPAAETRAFVERVMANYWIYRLRFDQDTPTLDSVVRGFDPIYESQDSLQMASAAF